MKALQVLHVEADVVEHAALGGHGRRRRSWRSAIARPEGRRPGLLRMPGLAPKMLARTRPGSRDRGFRHEEMDVLVLDRETFWFLSSRISIRKPSGVVTKA